MLKDLIKTLENKIECSFIEKNFGLALMKELKKFYELYNYLDQEILTRIRAVKNQNDIQKLQSQWEIQILTKVQKELVRIMQNIDNDTLK